MVSKCNLPIQGIFRTVSHKSPRCTSCGWFGVHSGIPIRQTNVAIIENKIRVIIFQLFLVLKANKIRFKNCCEIQETFPIKTLHVNASGEACCPWDSLKSLPWPKRCCWLWPSASSPTTVCFPYPKSPTEFPLDWTADSCSNLSSFLLPPVPFALLHMMRSWLKSHFLLEVILNLPRLAQVSLLCSPLASCT